MSKIERIDKELEMLEDLGSSSKIVILPIMREIIEFELEREQENPRRGIRVFNVCDKSDVTLTLVIATLDLENVKQASFFDPEYYEIECRPTSILINIGERSPLRENGLRVYASKDGVAEKAVFIIDNKTINIPMPNRKISDIKNFIKFQRELERIENTALMNLIVTGSFKRFKYLVIPKKKLIKRMTEVSKQGKE